MCTKKCPICSSVVRGRADKIFCSTKCKSIDQYEKRQETEAFYFIVEKQLRINRKILKRFNKSGFTTIRKSKLVEDGFNPKFFTHYWKNKKDDVYLFVYEYGFLSKNENGKDKYVLVTWQDYMTKDLK
ncbi:hypothetical protein [Flagellimonas pacifica]|uniref:DUF2116 family Zn-ribbon domain-containing protein n=1 Tax=Flagellimonas pacifica TaxID=1247520 RepID=A0A285MWA4_9FLAO|nr:hypothetical protein [Allomuricauda parva]SNZ00963.1 hypothetical protein SAMN06265377_2793 [Allomuricauda parva]